MNKKARGKELIFISRIERDGSGVQKFAPDADMSFLDNTIFRLSCLSITQGTWIASEFNSYVVKFKNQNNG